jgi:hypothetical protein
LTTPIVDEDDARLLFVLDFAAYIEGWHAAQAAPAATSPSFLTRETMAFALVPTRLEHE